MNDLSVIDRFLDTFSRFIDSGFDLLGGLLAGLFWVMGSASGGGGVDVIGKLIKKVRRRKRLGNSRVSRVGWQHL